MKIKVCNVTNSSSCSFLLVGKKVTIEEAKEKNFKNCVFYDGEEIIDIEDIIEDEADDLEKYINIHSYDENSLYESLLVEHVYTDDDPMKEIISLYDLVKGLSKEELKKFKLITGITMC